MKYKAGAPVNGGHRLVDCTINGEWFFGGTEEDKVKTSFINCQGEITIKDFSAGLIYIYHFTGKIIIHKSCKGGRVLIHHGKTPCLVVHDGDVFLEIGESE